MMKSNNFLSSQRDELILSMEQLAQDAKNLVASGSVKEAVKLRERHLAIARVLFPDGSQEVSESQLGLALIQYDSGELQTAAKTYSTVAKDEHASVSVRAEAELGWGNSLSSVGKLEPAKKHYMRCLELIPSEDMDDARRTSVFFNIGLVEWKQGDVCSAESSWIEARRVSENCFGIERDERKSVIGEIEYHIGRGRAALGKHKEALRWYDSSLRNSTPEEHSSVESRVFSSMALSYMKSGDIKSSINALHIVKRHRQEKYGKDSMEAGDVYAELGVALFTARKLQSSHQYFARCLSIRKKCIGDGDERTVDVGEKLSQVDDVMDVYRDRMPLSAKKRKDRVDLRRIAMEGEARRVLGESAMSPSPARMQRSGTLGSIMTEATWNIPDDSGMHMEQDLSGFEDIIG